MNTTHTQHTPGPWKDDGHDGRSCIIVTSQWGSVAKIWDVGDYMQETANARLIAASPDLLNELSRVVSWFEQFQAAQRGGGDMLSLLQNVDLSDARAAIAKATGKDAK